MNHFNPGALICALNSHPEVFICGPSIKDSNKEPRKHLRVYANGGILCEIPTTQKSEIHITSFKEYLPQETQDSLKEELDSAFFDKTSRDAEIVNRKNEKRAEFLMDEKKLKLLLDAIKDNNTNDGSLTERLNQTDIARKHRDFQAHKRVFTACGQTAPKEYLTVACDFEMTIPGSWYKRGASLLGFQEKPSAQCDLVTFSCTQDVSGPWLISIIELKCNKAACQGSESGLTAHARDMAVCMAETNRSDYILEILRRLSYMLRYGLLKNVPEGLEAEVNRLLPGSWKDPKKLRQSQEKVRNRGICLRSCFLFTGDDDIRADGSRPNHSLDAAMLCKKAEYLKEHLEDFSYQFWENPSDVDLSDMESWESFSSCS